MTGRSIAVALWLAVAACDNPPVLVRTELRDLPDVVRVLVVTNESSRSREVWVHLKGTVPADFVSPTLFEPLQSGDSPDIARAKTRGEPARVEGTTREYAIQREEGELVLRHDSGSEGGGMWLLEFRPKNVDPRSYLPESVVHCCVEGFRGPASVILMNPDGSPGAQVMIDADGRVSRLSWVGVSATDIAAQGAARVGGVSR